DTVAIFAGAGVEGAHDEVVALAEAVNAPIGHSLRGKDFIQHDNPYDVGMTGLLGYGAAHAGIHDAELLILLGTDFPYQQFLPSDGKTRIAQVDVDAAAISRRAAVDVPVHGDVAETLRQLAPLVSRKSDRRFLDRTLKKHEKIMTGTVGAYASNVASLVPIHPEYVASVLDRVAPEDTVFTTDTGMTNVWAARYLHTSPRRRALGSYLHGSMANALPQAIGAQLADPERPVVSMSGDGGLGMLLGELLTVKALELPLTVLVFNNSTLGMVKAEMLVDGLPDFGVDVPEVDYAALAASLGFQARRVTAAGDVEAALSEAIAHRGPSLVDVVTDPRALSLPPEITGAQIGGFALAMSKVVLNGGVGEAVAMARSNLRNIPRP
ncbi:thiamine pyrophosphate-dependent enzyme, partial [Mycetocola reblochoni]